MDRGGYIIKKERDRMVNNTQLDLARKFLEQTGTNIFLTGKAGTGKTTFLRQLRESSPKRMIVVAPTGVAAMNAGGVTIHSFFQLPFGPYVPAMQAEESKNRLRMNFSREKISIIKSMDLLVIDEISMVRADLLDAINDVLQRYRDRTKPFGGVQLLMIGDLQQLAPVVMQDEWRMLHEHYKSPYFFDSKALCAAEYITVELRHIYRQSDSQFIDILNRVRENNLDPETLCRLNSRYIPNFEPPQSEGYITLTSHNNAARAINDQKLDLLNSPAYTFMCEVEGDFPEYIYPNDSRLTLKKGAQVMFVKNDTSGQQRYFNGKIGQVSYIDQNRIEVTLDNLPDPISVEIAEWSNAKYTIDPHTKEIVETVEGVFRQFPLKAAWAITIHKSQGLTFDRAIIDAADSFSHGQVYVALSRCRSFEGLVLRTPLQCSAIISDATVSAYTKSAQENQPDETVLSTQSRLYCRSLLVDMFDFVPLRTRLWMVQKIFKEHLEKLYPKLSERWSEMMFGFGVEIFAVSEKFHRQIETLMAATADPEHDPLLSERLTKAQAYFLAKCEQMVVPLVEQSGVEVDNKETKKMLADALKRLREVLTVKLALLSLDNSAGFVVHNYLDTRAKATLNEIKIKTPKTEKVSSTETDFEDIQNPELFELLRQWRRGAAERDNVSSYVIMRQRTLITICRELPRNGVDLRSIKGIGKSFMTKYSDQVLAIIHDWVDGKM